MPAQLRRKGVRQGADPHLDAVPVFDERRTVLADQHFRRRRLGKILGYQRRIIFHQIIETADMDQISMGIGNVGVDDGNPYLCGLDRRDGTVHGSPQRDIAVGIRTRHLDQGRSQLDETLTVQFLALSQMDRQVVCITGIDIGPDVGTHEKALLEENTLIPGLRVWRGTFRMEVVEMQVTYIPGIGPAAQRLDQDMRHTGDAAQVDMAMGGNVADGLIGGNETEICHNSVSFRKFGPSKILNNSDAYKRRETGTILQVAGYHGRTAGEVSLECRPDDGVHPSDD